MTQPITLRSGVAGDAAACAKICFEAFNKINSEHGFVPDIPSPAMAEGFIAQLIVSPHVFSIIAEVSGKIAGSTFLWKGTIGGIGPVTVDPNVQNAGVGKAMMQRAIEIADENKMPGVRLVQAAFHNRSLSLYTKLGFDVREPLACIQGKPSGEKIPGYTVRKMTQNDLDACDAVCRRVHGHDRRGELMYALAQGTAKIVEHDGEITGYSADVGFFAHSVGLSNEAIKALIAATETISGPGLLLPSRNSELFRWCLEQGLRITQPMTLMSRGLYNEPRGAFLPSINF